MNSKVITSAIIIVVGLFAAMMVITQVLSGNWNAIGQLFKYLTIGSAISAFIAPKFGFWLLLLTTGYLDMLKRTLIFAGSTNLLDVALVLAMSPLIAAGIFAGVVLRDGLAGELFTPKNSKILIGVCVLGGALGISGYFASGGLGGIRSAANFSAYTTLLYTLPKLFTTKQEVWRMLKITVLLFIPVAIYSYVQMFRGLSWWEILYLETGLSGEERILTGQDFRCFSTLNSSQNLSKIMSMMLVLSAFIPWFSKDERRTAGSRIFSLCLMILFGGAAYTSGSRTGWVMAVVALLAIWVFRYRALTLLSYASFLVILVVVITSAEQMLRSKVLNRWTNTLIAYVNPSRDSDISKRLNLATLSIRLASLDNLRDPRFWTPFGFKMAGRSVEDEGRATHDIISKLVVQLGYIPLSILFIAFIITLAKIHSNVWRNSEDRRLMLLAFGLVVCVIVGGLSATENLSTFPVNTFLYLAGGILVFLIAGYAKKPVEQKEAKSAVAGLPDGRPALA